MSKTTSLVILLSVAMVFAAAQALAGGMSGYSGHTSGSGYFRSDIPEITGTAPESMPGVTCTVDRKASESVGLQQRPDVPEIAWLSGAYAGAENVISTCSGTGIRVPSEDVPRLDIPEMWYHEGYGG
jgi:hypothetical protein